MDPLVDLGRHRRRGDVGDARDAVPPGSSGAWPRRCKAAPSFGVDPLCLCLRHRREARPRRRAPAAMTVPGGSPLCALVLRVVPGARRAPQHNVLVVADGRLVVCGGEEACSHPPLPSLRPCRQRMVDCRGSDARAACARPARTRELTVRVVMPEWHHLRFRGRTAIPSSRQHLERFICLAARSRRRLEALAGGGVVVARSYQAAAVAVRIHRRRHP